MSNNVYDKIDRIYCISLTTTPDKLANAKKLFMKLGFEHKVRYHIVERHPLGGNVGCFVSHTEIIKECYADPNCKSVLIFEDDVILGKFHHIKHMNRVGNFIESNKDWDLIKLGYSVHPVFFHEMVFSKTQKDSLQQFPSMLTHAYVISRKGMKKHLDKFNKIDLRKWDIRQKSNSSEYNHFRYNFDIVFHHSMITYNVIPIQFWQNLKGSSIDHSFLQNLALYIGSINEYVFVEEYKSKMIVFTLWCSWFVTIVLAIYFIIVIIFKTLQPILKS
jgi:GR25 family glycosyltransferase involved in LPS biosynthesis